MLIARKARLRQSDQELDLSCHRCRSELPSCQVVTANECCVVDLVRTQMQQATGLIVSRRAAAWTSHARAQHLSGTPSGRLSGCSWRCLPPSHAAQRSTPAYGSLLLVAAARSTREMSSTCAADRCGTNSGGPSVAAYFHTAFITKHLSSQPIPVARYQVRTALISLDSAPGWFEIQSRDHMSADAARGFAKTDGALTRLICRCKCCPRLANMQPFDWVSMQATCCC